MADIYSAEDILAFTEILLKNDPRQKYKGKSQHLLSNHSGEKIDLRQLIPADQITKEKTDGSLEAHCPVCQSMNHDRKQRGHLWVSVDGTYWACVARQCNWRKILDLFLHLQKAA